MKVYFLLGDFGQPEEQKSGRLKVLALGRVFSKWTDDYIAINGNYAPMVYIQSDVNY